MKIKTLLKFVILLCAIKSCTLVYAALRRIDWNAKSDWSAVGKCAEHDNCFVISNLTSGFVSHRICSPEGKTVREVRVFPANMFPANAQTRPNVGSKVIRLEKKERKPIKYGEVIWAGYREFDKNDPKAYDEFWASSLEEQKKYPLTLRRKFVHTRRARQMRAEQEKLRAENPKEFAKRKRVSPTKVPYTKEEIEILGTDDRRLTVSEKLSTVKSGKVSNQSKIGNKVMNLEVK